MKKRILFLINPISGVKKKANLAELIPSYFPAEEFIIQIKHTNYAGHAVELAKWAVDLGYSAVVACGGDGTINEIGSVLVGSNTALGIIPLGSGNGLARHLGISLKVKKALRIIAQFSIKLIDTGEVNKRPFIGIAGLGFDAHIGKKFANYGKRGFFSYLKLVLKEYLDFKERTVIIKRKGNKETLSAIMITIANSSQFGNNAIIAPNAIIDDGKLKMCIVKKFPLWRAPKIAWLMMTRRIHRSKYIDIIEIKKATIKQPKKLIHVDGEPIKMARKIKVRVLPQSLAVLVP